MLRLLILLCLAALPLRAEEVVLGLSADEVAITANFDGSELLVFGAVKREGPILDEPLEVIVTIAGPSAPLTVRRKEKKLGIWVNTDSVEVKEAPSFYAVATTGPLKEVLAQIEDLRHRISIPKAIRLVGASPNVSNPQSFSQAVIRIRKKNRSYQLLEGAVALDQQTLFRTSIQLPSNLTEGDYATRIFLTRNGYVVSEFETKIDVRKVGLERWLYNLSREQPMIYGLMSLAIAIAAGWGAAAAFQMLRRG
ncbi:TIGR02186 family protein [uncultured Roseovarius sp.]|uniref:TIGR02186 family protein n=1 Tax=uncultured Roseovarius sp. TaxID=293344 RepID=UPI0026353510|nr:TIGR02186 family protein [uncultured Roseovarius sp.]